MYVTWSIACSLCDNWAYCNDVCTKLYRKPNKKWQLLKVLFRLTRNLFVQQLSQHRVGLSAVAQPLVFVCVCVCVQICMSVQLPLTGQRTASVECLSSRNCFMSCQSTTLRRSVSLRSTLTKLPHGKNKTRSVVLMSLCLSLHLMLWVVLLQKKYSDNVKFLLQVLTFETTLF